MSLNPFPLLKQRRFLPLFITQSLQAFNDAAYKNAVVILITFVLVTQPKHIEQLVTLSSLLFILPFLLFSALAGTLADKYPKHKIVRIVKMLEVIFIGLGMIAVYTQSITTMLVAILLLGLHSTFFGPIKYALLPEHLSKNELLAGNGLIESSTFLMILLGTLFGSMVITTHFGHGIATLLMMSFALLGWGSSFFIPNTQAYAPELPLEFNIVKSSWNMLKSISKHTLALRSIMVISWFWALGQTILIGLPQYAKHNLHVNPQAVGLFLGIFSIGIAIGALLINRVLKNRISVQWLPLNLLVISLAFADFIFISQPFSASPNALVGIPAIVSSFNGWHMIVALSVMAISSGMMLVPLYTLLQTSVPSVERSRTIAVCNIINSFFMVLSAVVNLGLLSIGFNMTGIFVLTIIVNLLFAAYAFSLLPFENKKLLWQKVLRLLYRVEVNGLEHLEKISDNYLITANHTALIDILLISAFLPDQYQIALTQKNAKKKWLKLFLSLVNVMPIDQRNPFSTRDMIQATQRGAKFIIFPEGELSLSQNALKVYEAPSLIAASTHTPIIPVLIEGAQYTPFARSPKRFPTQWFPKITISINPPFNLKTKGVGHERRHCRANELYTLIMQMNFKLCNINTTLFSALLDAKETYGAKTLIAEDIQRSPISYKQFVMRSLILGDVISRVTHTTEAVGVLMPTSTTTMLLFFALQAFNRVPAMLNFSTGSNSLLSSCTTSQIKTIYTARKFISTAKLEPLVATLEKAGLNVIYLEDLKTQVSLLTKVKGVFRTFTARSFYKRNYPVSADDKSVILFTSGSEGTPKAVVLSHKNILSNVCQMQTIVDYNQRDIMFNALPVFHCFGLTAGAILPLLSGTKAFFYPSPLHYRVVPELIYDTNATIMFGTDTFLSGYARYAKPYHFSSMRYIFAGAEKVKPDTTKNWAERFGARVFEGYGATECSPVISLNTPMKHKLGAVGCLNPGMSYRLVPVEGISTGGRLWVSGPSVMLGYMKSDQPGQLQPPAEGWHDTGDIVSVDDEGYLSILGRAKRFAKIGGEMVSLTAVETYLSQLWPNHTHAAITIPDPKKGESVVLFTDNPKAQREAIVSFARAQGLAELYIPKSIRIVASIPLLATGKINYAGLNEHNG